MPDISDDRRRNPNKQPIFVDLAEPESAVTKRTKYERIKIEKGITRRSREDGSGRPVFDAQVWVSHRATSKTFGRLQDARSWRDQMLGKRASGERLPMNTGRIRLEEFVQGPWMKWLDEEVRMGSLREGTASWYRGGSKHVIRELGRYRLRDISKDELRGMLARRVDAGDSAHMLRWIRATTRSILALAVEQDVVSADPSSFMVGKNAPKVLRRSATAAKAWSKEEARQFLRAVQGDRLEALWLLLLTSGLRRGESLALQWRDLDFDAGTLSVSKALVQIGGVPTMSRPKTPRSHRTIAVGAETLDSLKAHRRSQSEERLASTEWAGEDYIFTRKNGSLLRPDQVYVAFKRIVEKEGLPWIRLHGLRHTMASLALQNGVDVATVSERLGHADVGITTRTYLHGSEESDRHAASVVGAVLTQ